MVRGYMVRGYMVRGYMVRGYMVRGYMVRGLEGYMVRGYMVRGLGMAYSCHSDAIVMPYSLVWQSYGKAMGSAWQGAGVAECDKILWYILYIGIA